MYNPEKDLLFSSNGNECLKAHYNEFVQVYKVGKKDGDHGAKTEFDPTNKGITPMGGFVGYGEVKEDYVIIKVCISPLSADCRVL